MRAAVYGFDKIIFTVVRNNAIHFSFNFCKFIFSNF